MANQEEVAKARIIKHMNNDHHDSVVRYLQHYAKLSAFTAYDGQMSDLDLNGFSLVCQGKTYQVPFEPPMKSYSEARERVVELDKKCRQALGHSDVTVNTFVPPSGVHVITFAVTLLTFVIFSQRWWFEPGQIAEQCLGAQFAGVSYRIQPYLFYGLVGVHALEAVILAQGKLKKHSVNPRTSTYWLWVLCNLIEGFPTAQRFNRLISKLSEKKH